MESDELVRIVRAVEARATPAALASEIHGPRHWRDVARLGNALRLGNCPDADAAVVLLFALLHDSQRETDGHDPYHGRRAAHFAEQLRADGIVTLDDRQASTLMTALALHADGDVSDDPTIGTCWDADRLTLVRVGARLRFDLLSTLTSQQASWAKRQLICIVGADLDWSAIHSTRRPGLTMYHGTAAANLPAIQSGGLREGRRQDGIFMTPTKRMAFQFAANRAWRFVRPNLAEIRQSARRGEITFSESRKASRAALNDACAVLTLKIPEHFEFGHVDEGCYGFSLMVARIPASYITEVETYNLLDACNIGSGGKNGVFF